jgi:hypothetical protein
LSHLRIKGCYNFKNSVNYIITVCICCRTMPLCILFNIIKTLIILFNILAWFLVTVHYLMLKSW